MRFIASTFLASGVDSFIFGTLAFAGLMSNSNLFLLIITMWGFKVGIEILGLPFSLYLTQKLKKLERLDIYDKKTRFNLFSLKVNYTEKDNAY